MVFALYTVMSMWYDGNTDAAEFRCALLFGNSCFGERRSVTAIDPMKRGLKVYRLHKVRILDIVTAIDPMKRGLKVQKPSTHPHRCYLVTAIDPMKRGLKVW